MPTKVLVLGGKGFIGRHAVEALLQQGVQQAAQHDVELVVGTRSPTEAGHGTAERRFCLENMGSAADWQSVVEEFDVILNCVGILRPTRQASYEQVHHLAPAAIASACGQDVRFVHVSALGLKPTDRSGFLISKRHGEQAIEATKSNWIITRPSLLDGEGGYGAKWLRGVAKLPVFVTPSDARGEIAALMVTDLGEALARLCLATDKELQLDASRVFELGGSLTYDFESYIRALRLRYSAKPAMAIPLPGIVARIGAHICDALRVTPFSFGHWELLRKDNVPQPNRLPELLQRAPTTVISEQHG